MKFTTLCCVIKRNPLSLRLSSHGAVPCQDPHHQYHHHQQPQRHKPHLCGSATTSRSTSCSAHDNWSYRRGTTSPLACCDCRGTADARFFRYDQPDCHGTAASCSDESHCRDAAVAGYLTAGVRTADDSYSSAWGCPAHDSLCTYQQQYHIPWHGIPVPEFLVWVFRYQSPWHGVCTGILSVGPQVLEYSVWDP